MLNVFFCLSNDSPSFQPRPLGQLQGTRAPLERAPVIPTTQAVMERDETYWEGSWWLRVSLNKALRPVCWGVALLAFGGVQYPSKDFLIFHRYCIGRRSNSTTIFCRWVGTPTWWEVCGALRISCFGLRMVYKKKSRCFLKNVVQCFKQHFFVLHPSFSSFGICYLVVVA